MSNILSKVAKVVRLYRKRRTTPLRLELNLTQACNLNCRGCTHYSPLAPADDAVELSTIDKVLRHLSKVKGIQRLDHLYLIGGETLLYPHLEEVIALVRKYFPATPVSLFTNGIMLPRMKDSFWEACRNHNICIDITRYPIKVNYDALFDLVKSRGVKVHQFADRNADDSFLKFPLDPRKCQSARMAHFTCFNFGCLSIIGDRLYPCSISGCIDYLNARCGTDFKHEKGDYLEISEIRNVSQILSLRNRPVPFCAYCARPTPTAYGASKREASEWVQE